MEFTIYTFGNVPMLWNALNAIAASSTNSWTLSAIGMGGLIGLVHVLATSISGTNDFRKIGSLVVGWGMLCSLALIPSTVWITDLFTGATKKVDNVPLLISAPYSVITSAGQSLFTRIDGSLSSTNGSYISVSQYGLISPIKILMSMRNPQLATALTPDLYNSLKQSMMDCAMGGSITLKDVFSSGDVLTSVTTGFRQTGITIWYDSSVPGGMQDIACADVGSKLVSEFQRQYNATQPLVAPGNAPPINTIITQGVAASDGKKFTFGDYQNVFDSIVGGAFRAANQSLGQTAAQAAINSLSASTIAYTLNCMAELSSSTSVNCQEAGLVNSDTAEQFKNDSVQNASFFTSIMYSSMAFLTFLFFALAPIVLVVALLWPMHSLKLFMAYLMFGMWVSSWAIFYAPMGIFIQSEVQNVFSAYLSSGKAITLATYSQVYADLSTKLAIASNAVASIPLISLAILSGSFFSLNSVAKRFSGEANSDPSLMSNRMRTNAALDQSAPESQSSLTSKQSMMANAPTMTLETTMGKVLGVSSASGFQNSQAFATRDGVTHTDQSGRTVKTSWNDIEKWSRDHKKSTDLGYKATGFGSAMALSSEYRGHLDALQRDTGWDKNSAAKAVGNAAVSNAIQNNPDLNIPKMLSGENGEGEKKKAEGIVSREMGALAAQKAGMAAAVIGSAAGKAALATADANVATKAANVMLGGVPAGWRSLGKTALDKLVGDIDIASSQMTSESFLHGQGWSKSTSDEISRAKSLSKGFTAEQAKTLKKDESHQFTNAESSSEQIKTAYTLPDILASVRNQAETNRPAFENNYQSVTDLLNSGDTNKINRFWAMKQRSGMAPRAPNSLADREQNLAIYKFFEAEEQRRGVVGKADNINHTGLVEKVEGALKNDPYAVVQNRIGQKEEEWIKGDVGPDEKTKANLSATEYNAENTVVIENSGILDMLREKTGINSLVPTLTPDVNQRNQFQTTDVSLNQGGQPQTGGNGNGMSGSVNPAAPIPGPNNALPKAVRPPNPAITPNGSGDVNQRNQFQTTDVSLNQGGQPQTGGNGNGMPGSVNSSKR